MTAGNDEAAVRSQRLFFCNRFLSTVGICQSTSRLEFDMRLQERKQAVSTDHAE